MSRFEIVWTIHAQRELDFIYEYYSLLSEKAALRIIDEILFQTQQLSRFPYLGEEEYLLKHLDKDYRALVINNYKIIYRLANNRVFIVDVFDARQNPKKNTRNK